MKAPTDEHHTAGSIVTRTTAAAPEGARSLRYGSGPMTHMTHMTRGMERCRCTTSCCGPPPSPRDGTPALPRHVVTQEKAASLLFDKE